LTKVNGVEQFCGLFSLTNHLSQLRVCALVATKAHSQFEIGLSGMVKSLALYGHPQPKVVYTDNPSDQKFLEASIPSLLEDVVPIRKYSHLDTLTIPKDVSVILCPTTESVERAILTIMDSEELDINGTLTVGFDSEWNVDLSQGGAAPCRTAILQIAYEKFVYILQVSRPP
jgi:hypothetical protein